ncbi:MAG: hypothetical protein AAFY38_04375 [Pseudomonadota bacterium]
MSQPRITRIYLEKSLRQSAEAGQHNFLGLVSEVLEARGMRVEFKTSTKPELLKGAMRPGYSLIHMKPPVGPNGLVFRRAYHYPFWQIDRTDERWNWQVAQTPLPEERSDEADGFFRRWRKRLFPDIESSKGGYIYAPLQGRIREHRSFQSRSPIDMLRHIRASRPNQRIIATLHPKEQYDAADLAALGDLDVEVETGQMDRFLPHCDVVATMNSSVAFDGFFLEKPAILYGKIDFHHIALGPDDWDRVDNHRPDYAHFVHWFWQQQCINAGHRSAKACIAAKLDQFGWPK